MENVTGKLENVTSGEKNAVLITEKLQQVSTVICIYIGNQTLYMYLCKLQGLHCLLHKTVDF